MRTPSHAPLNKALGVASRIELESFRMDITSCAKADYDQIVTHIQEFWGGDRTLNLHHPMFVVRVRQLGLHHQRWEPGCGLPLWLHLTDGAYCLCPSRRGQRAVPAARPGASSVRSFCEVFALIQGCTELKAITTPGNKESIAFHRSLGMELTGKLNRDGVQVIKDYAGPGQDRVVFRKTLTQADAA